MKAATCLVTSKIGFKAKEINEASVGKMEEKNKSRCKSIKERRQEGNNKRTARKQI